MVYAEWQTLQTRGAVDPGPDMPVDGSLLVGTEVALRFESGHSGYGYDDTEIFPAFHEGKRCWVRRDIWCATGHYSASGTSEEIISFEEGVKLFLEKGVFAFSIPEKATI